MKGYSLESWEFLKDGLIVTEGKEIYYEIYQMENFLNGAIDEMVDNLIAADRAERLKGEEE